MLDNAPARNNVPLDHRARADDCEVDRHRVDLVEDEKILWMVRVRASNMVVRVQDHI